MKFETLRKHKFRYIAFLLGFLFFVYPFSFITRIVLFLQGSLAHPDLHRLCIRMPVDWIFSGRYLPALSERGPILAFIPIVLIISFFLGPLFCGWLCPVGSFTESISRQVPSKVKMDFRKKINPAAIRYGFFAAFILIPILTLIGPGTPVLGACCPPAEPRGGPPDLASAIGLASICCRYCASSQLQNIVAAVTVNPSTLAYWHSGAIIAIVLWLFLGGIFMVGGRGWCNFLCPLGAFSNLLHYVGSKLGFTYKIRREPSKCTDCGRCEKVCPVWAIVRTSSKTSVEINRHLCNCCLECVKFCPQNCYSYSRGVA